MQAAVRALIGIGGGPDRALATALVLNIALILFGWRRYKDLNREIVERTEAEQRARYLADTDPLAGFLNRRALLVAGQRMIAGAAAEKRQVALRSEEHTSALQSLMRISYAVFCLKKNRLQHTIQ